MAGESPCLFYSLPSRATPICRFKIERPGPERPAQN
jgi:hypothetical protein